MSASTSAERSAHDILLATMVPGRSCGTCSMCCKVFRLPWVDPDKKANAWCKNCSPGKGCAVYDTRPEPCMSYYCQWMFTPQLGAEWRPDAAKFVLNISHDEFWLEVVADLATPHVWRTEPYLSTLRATAANRMEQGKGVLVRIGTRRFILTPTEEIDMAAYPDNATFAMSKTQVGGRATYHVQVFANAAA